MSALKYFSNIVAGIILFSIMTAATGWLTLWLLTRGGEAAVPDVAGLDLPNAMKTLQDRKLYGVIFSETSHPGIPRGCVVKQDPAQGEMKKQYSSVKLTISSGPDRLIVADMRGYGIRQARIESAQLGLGVVTEIPIHHPATHQGAVIAHAPGSQEVIIPGAPITFLVSLGPLPLSYRMPDFIGKNVDFASGILGVDLIPEISYVKRSGIKTGTIVGQTPQAGDRLKEDDPIRLDVVDESMQSESQPSLFSYRLPSGLVKKNVQIVLDQNDEKKTIFEKRINPGEEIKLFIPRSGDAKIEVVVDGITVQTNTW